MTFNRALRYSHHNLHLSTRRVRKADRTYEYLDIVESFRVQGRVRRKILGTLGRLDQIQPRKIDGLIEHLRKLASPEGSRGLRLGEVRILATREYGVALAARRLWEQLGLDELLGGLGAGLEEAVFRMVVNRLSEPQSKLALVDHHGRRQGREWQARVEWPSGRGQLTYNQYLRAMDQLHPLRSQIEDQLFFRVTELFSLPLRLVFYDVTSSYFEGDGVCELADYGHSSDHREDRAQVVVGLAITQEGLPITHRVFPGDTVDVSTLVPLSKELKDRFGLPEAVLVGDRGMFSAENLAGLAAGGFKYVLSLRSRQQEEFGLAVKTALRAGFRKPQDLDSERSWAEVAIEPGHRHLVVYSALRAEHDFEVRERRLERALEPLARLRQRAAKEKLPEKAIVERATRILVENKVAKYFNYSAERGFFSFWLRRDIYREERRQDGFFVLKTNHLELSPAEILASYLQLQEVERAFRVVKSLLKLRPIYHWRQRRVETHIFITFLAFLIAKALELKLRAAGLELSIARALDQLSRLTATEHTWEEQARVVQASQPDREVEAILAALGISLRNPILRVTPALAA